MTERFLTITLQPDWEAGLRAAAKAAQQSTYSSMHIDMVLKAA